MADDILLGIDLGTTVLKAAAFSRRTGKSLADASVRLPVRSAADGMCEQDLHAVDRALRRVALTLRRRLGRSWSHVAGIGLAAQGGSAIIVDRRTGEARTPMQLWNDTRPRRLLSAIAARKPEAYWRRLSYLDEPGAGLARIQWLRDRYPRLFHDGNLYAGAGEYLYHKLTGFWRQDAGNALQIGCYDVRRRRLAGGPLQLVGVTKSFVAPMREGHEMHPLSPGGATFLGLPQGTPVVGPYIDQEAGYLSATGASARPLQCSLGTAWVGNFVVEKPSPASSGLQLLLPSPVGEGWLAVRATAVGNLAWDWGLATLLDRKPGKALARADAVFAESLLPPEGLVALPWFNRRNLFLPEASGGGGFLGLNPHTTPADLLRALVAGMCFEFARVFEPVVESGAVDRVVLGGGASKGGYFGKLLAGLFAPLPVFRLEEDAVAAARGTLYAFSRKVARGRTRRVPAPPQRLRDRIRKGYQQYRRVCETLARGLPDGGAIPRGCRKRRKR
jgi:sugar (pentulose or hexulose) kinase